MRIRQSSVEKIGLSLILVEKNEDFSLSENHTFCKSNACFC
ncbi:hypothetical protein LEP1GSC024_2081 [Leptospira noguchii str. 2001034031]|uniref:Uncharacterized protein n=1 Tax=Leptospira noguchii str. 2001034031 TaxID=1193053 RepID=M6YAD4_9LEPT|nr:hypothetical protein LEP1GSC024_2081 [Leptospira noguchii str. 2001034031]